MITSVAQIPIESIVFPPVTVCPIMTLEENQDETEDESVNWTVQDLVQNCSFTKDSLDTGEVCDRIQV